MSKGQLQLPLAAHDKSSYSVRVNELDIAQLVFGGLYLV